MIELWREYGSTRIATVIVCAFCIIVGGIAIGWFLPIGHISYSDSDTSATTTDMVATTTAPVASSTPPAFVVTHIQTPDPLKAVYMTSWAAGSRKFRDHLYDLVDHTEINAVVIDIKDYTGRISFPIDNPDIIASGAVENRIPDIKEFIANLHKRGVYVIGRVSSFQDSYLINTHPEWAVKTKEGAVWKDYKGVKWLDAGAKPVWDYLITIGKESYHQVGFDEINFDYIRFPSDGNLKDISYTWSEGKDRAQVMKSFFEYVHTSFKDSGIPTSVDLFGLTTSADGDLGIGQILEYGLKYFDYVAPMVYPSHFGNGFNGYAKPAEHPYEVINFSMQRAIAKAEATTTKYAYLGDEPIASTTPQKYTKETYDYRKLRPWLQAFDLGAIYTPDMVRAQIKATYDNNLTSWMLWNAGSIYKKDALLPK